MEAHNCLSSEVLERYPFLKDIIAAANQGNPKDLIKVLEYCIHKIIISENFQGPSLMLENEKNMELISTRVGEHLKKDINRIANIRGIGASTFLRQAAEYYRDFLLKDIRPAK
jgi:hypothetical protein